MRKKCDFNGNLDLGVRSGSDPTLSEKPNPEQAPTKNPGDSIKFWVKGYTSFNF